MAAGALHGALWGRGGIFPLGTSPPSSSACPSPGTGDGCVGFRDASSAFSDVQLK